MKYNIILQINTEHILELAEKIYPLFDDPFVFSTEGKTYIEIDQEGESEKSIIDTAIDNLLKLGIEVVAVQRPTQS